MNIDESKIILTSQVIIGEEHTIKCVIHGFGELKYPNKKLRIIETTDGRYIFLNSFSVKNISKSISGIQSKWAGHKIFAEKKERKSVDYIVWGIKK